MTEKKVLIDFLRHAEVMIDLLIDKIEREFEIGEYERIDIENVRNFLKDSGEMEVKFIHTLLSFEEDSISDEKICNIMNISASSVKVYASKSRVILNINGISSKIIRVRGVGYRIEDRESIKEKMIQSYKSGN